MVLLADPNKFPGSGLARVCGPDDIDVLVVARAPIRQTLAAFGDAGCRVVEA